MNIMLDDQKVVGYANYGSIENGIEVNSEMLPINFISEFNKHIWKYQNGNIVCAGDATTPDIPHTTSIEERLSDMEQALLGLLTEGLL